MSSIELHCIIDRSGSMAEYGKPMLLVNLLRYIRQISHQHGINSRYLSWGLQLTEINWPVEMDVELPSAEGSGDIAALEAWGQSHPQATLLVLTDGYFEINVEHRQQLALLDNLHLIAVGGDADLARLNTLSEHSYRAEQLDQALHALLRPEPAASAPLTRVKLPEGVMVSHEATVESEDDDEW